MKQTRSLSEFSCLSEYNRLYPTSIVLWIGLRSVIVSFPGNIHMFLAKRIEGVTETSPLFKAVL